MLDLRRPIYKQTATYGHFGRTDVIIMGTYRQSCDFKRASWSIYMKKALRGERKAFYL